MKLFKFLLAALLIGPLAIPAFAADEKADKKLEAVCPNCKKEVRPQPVKLKKKGKKKKSKKDKKKEKKGDSSKEAAETPKSSPAVKYFCPKCDKEIPAKIIAEARKAKQEKSGKGSDVDRQQNEPDEE